MRNAVVGGAVALGVALAASDITVAGIDAWKIVLACAGLAFFILSGRPDRTSR